MSQRLRILDKPITRREMLNILSIFERQTKEMIWDAMPWYKRLWRKWRVKQAKRRQSRPAESRVTRGETRESQATGRNGTTPMGDFPASGTAS
ncbi:MAG: hypothetical protein A4C66_03190 [Nitrospira sp. HN-bin3]|nr:MAG: hypothetical protein A4C66_03190 [Nitrospira sp. HN-bin3]